MSAENTPSQMRLAARDKLDAIQHELRQRAEDPFLSADANSAEYDHFADKIKSIIWELGNTLPTAERIAAFCEQTARDGILPSLAWFAETAKALRETQDDSELAEHLKYVRGLLRKAKSSGASFADVNVASLAYLAENRRELNDRRRWALKRIEQLERIVKLSKEDAPERDEP